VDVHDLPTLNACLNGIAATLITSGLIAVRSGRVALHKRCMAAAVTTSALFLTSYLVHKFSVAPNRFQGTGAIRFVYFTILISHTILAVAIVPLVTTTVVFALRNRLDRHRRLARFTWPIWLYVSVTGVVIYCFLYVGV